MEIGVKAIKTTNTQGGVHVAYPRYYQHGGGPRKKLVRFSRASSADRSALDIKRAGPGGKEGEHVRAVPRVFTEELWENRIRFPDV